MNAVLPTSDGHASESRLPVWLSWGVLLAGVGAGIATAYIVITTYSPVPHWDDWSLFNHLADRGGWSLAWLWAQHNEHRIFVTKLFFLLDVDLFHGTQTFLLISIFLVQLLQVALLSCSLGALAGLRGSAWRAGTGLIAYCILCPTQYENFVWGFQLQFVVPAAMATLSILALLLYRREKRSRFLIVCIAAATIATWSLANGMLLWPLLVIAAWWLRMKSPALAALLTFGLLNLALYFYHYHRPVSLGSNLPMLSIGGRLHYAVVYLGSTFVRHSSGVVALVAGIVGIGFALFILARVLRQRESPSPFLIELSFLIGAMPCDGGGHVVRADSSGSRAGDGVALPDVCSVVLVLSWIDFAVTSREKSSTVHCFCCQRAGDDAGICDTGSFAADRCAVASTAAENGRAVLADRRA